MHDFGTGPRHTDVWNRLADRQYRCRQMVADQPQTCGAATDQGDLTGSNHRPQSRTGVVDAHIAADLAPSPQSAGTSSEPRLNSCSVSPKRECTGPVFVAGLLTRKSGWPCYKENLPSCTRGYSPIGLMQLFIASHEESG
jgi:hypothetical protein